MSNQIPIGTVPVHPRSRSRFPTAQRTRYPQQYSGQYMSSTQPALPTAEASLLAQYQYGLGYQQQQQVSPATHTQTQPRDVYGYGLSAPTGPFPMHPAGVHGWSAGMNMGGTGFNQSGAAAGLTGGGGNIFDNTRVPAQFIDPVAPSSSQGRADFGLMAGGGNGFGMGMSANFSPMASTSYDQGMLSQPGINTDINMLASECLPWADSTVMVPRLGGYGEGSLGTGLHGNMGIGAAAHPGPTLGAARPVAGVKKPVRNANRKRVMQRTHESYNGQAAPTSTATRPQQQQQQQSSSPRRRNRQTRERQVSPEKEKKKKEVISCGFCDKIDTREKVERHEGRACPKNPNKERYTCARCGKTYSTKDYRDLHQNKVGCKALKWGMPRLWDEVEREEEFLEGAAGLPWLMTDAFNRSPGQVQGNLVMPQQEQNYAPISGFQWPHLGYTTSGANSSNSSSSSNTTPNTLTPPDPDMGIISPTIADWMDQLTLDPGDLQGSLAFLQTPATHLPDNVQDLDNLLQGGMTNPGMHHPNHMQDPTPVVNMSTSLSPMATLPPPPPPPPPPLPEEDPVIMLPTPPINTNPNPNPNPLAATGLTFPDPATMTQQEWEESAARFQEWLATVEGDEEREAAIQEYLGHYLAFVAGQTV